MGRSLRGMAERSGREGGKDNSIILLLCGFSLKQSLSAEPSTRTRCTSRLADSLTQS